MTSTRQWTGRRPAGRAALLLVFAVLAGVFAMHGLAPGGAPPGPAGHGTVAMGAGHEAGPAGAREDAADADGRTTPAPPTTLTADRHAPPVSGSHSPRLSPDSPHTCVHVADGGTSGHVRHADGTCAASGVSSSYAPPVLAVVPATTAAPPVPAGRATAATEIGRAPPDLALIQLLRI
ncbi:DUF6153 family protein [Streptomyces sp. NPDC088387]|uniref:DUF6153 family protein n=1 Tax=Streptomyces sp. NPDC088387 TaxID=3365859 RepID=UPI0037FAD7EF